ncbi:MAG: hypothetical protein CMJ52_09175 [Planctomycetaceae bacterium]|nr:hypothetical protein [Planctomycetaceae bacterium]
MPRILLVPAIAIPCVISATTTADTITVCASGCDYTSINAAIASAIDGDVIQLSAETYAEGVEIDTMQKAVTLLGVLDADGIPASVLDGGNTHRVLACRDGETNSTVLENLIVQNGRDSKQGGGGMLVSGASPTIRNCTFQFNSILSGVGAGMVVTAGAPVLTDCIFGANRIDRTSPPTYGGGLAVTGGTVTLQQCDFDGNIAAAGGGLFVAGGAVVATGCGFDGNVSSTSYSGDFEYGDGGNILNLADLTLDDCTVTDGTALCGGGIFHGGTRLIVTDGSIEGNTAQDEGGGLLADTSGATLTGCTINDNSPDGISGQVTNGFHQGFEGLLRIEDCSIHGNGDGETFRQLVGAVVHAGDNHISRHPPPSGCPSDLNGDGRVDAADLGLLIGAWGFCP